MPHPDDLKGIFIKKSIPAFVLQVLDKLATAAGFIILARILKPVDFGMAFLAQTFVTFFNTVKSGIFDSSLIYDRDDHDEMYEVGFTADLILAILLFVTIYSLAPLWAGFYNSAALKGAVRLYGIVIIIESLALVPKTRLIKKFKFTNVNAINLCTTLTRVSASIIFAVMGLAFWSVIYGSMISVVLLVALLFLAEPWRIRLHVNPDLLKRLINYGKYILIINIVGFALSEMSGAAIGKIIGIAAAGYFTVAYRWGFWTFNNIFTFLEYVLFPISSRYQEDQKTVVGLYRKTLGYSSLLVFPISLGTFLVVPEFTKIVLGPEWTPIIVPLRILSIAGLAHFLGYTSNPFLKGLGYVRAESHRIYLNITFLLIFLFPLSRLYGITGASVAILLASAATQILFYIYTTRFLKIEKLEMMKAVCTPFAASSFMCAAVLLLKRFIFHAGIERPVEFLVLAGSALCAYLLALLFFVKVVPLRRVPYILARAIIRKAAHGRVISGPFAGMKFITLNDELTHYPYLLGTHELELQPMIEELCRKSFRTIINVGAAKGYYAIGLGMRNPQVRVTAFEVNADDQYFIRRMAVLNNIEDRIAIRGLCDARLLSDSISDSESSLLIMDVEGGENILLDPIAIPRLERCHILVEVHDFISREYGDIISRRFRDSHKVTEIWSRERTLSDFPLKAAPLISIILKRYLIESMDEKRPGKMRWLYLEPR